jgi:hypothetical protein
MKWLRKPQGGLIAGLLLVMVILSPGTASTNQALDPVLEWNAIMRKTVATSPLFLQNRSATMMHLAMFEAVNAITKGYNPYLGTVTAPPGALPEAAAIGAAHRMLVSLHPARKESLDDLRDNSLSAIADSPAKSDGITVGVVAANAILALRADDGAANAATPPYTPGTAPGDWQPTPPAFPPALYPSWGKVATYGIQDGMQFRSAPPPALDSDTYGRDYNEVLAVGAVNSTVRPQDKTDRARYFGGNFPLHVFNETAIQLSTAQGKTLAENARIFALVNMAISDGLISSMESKFYYGYWRPVTAIRAGGTDGNQETEPDPDWLSLVVNPPYPSYPSNYASVANAARAVLEDVYGIGGHAITLQSGNPAVDVTLHYTEFSQMTDDINDARVYGGIHFRFEQDAGALMGWRVGSYILMNNLQQQ